MQHLLRGGGAGDMEGRLDQVRRWLGRIFNFELGRILNFKLGRILNFELGRILNFELGRIFNFEIKGKFSILNWGEL